MKKKTVITVILTAILLAAAVTLGVNNVFRVDGVIVNAPMVSEAAKAEAASLQEDLNELYAGASTLFAKQEKAEEVFEKYPYFRLTGFDRKYPNLLVIEATEDAEVFAVDAGASGYYILSADGTVLGKRETPENRADGGANILVSGIEVSGELGERVAGEGMEELLAATKVMSELLNGVRGNLQSVTAVRYGSVTQFTMKMREGVTVYLIKPESFTLEKARRLTEKYLALSDSERLTGTIVATNNDEGSVSVEYYARDLEE